MLIPLLTAALLSAAPASDSPTRESQSAPAVKTTPASSLRAKAPIIAGVGAALALSGSVLWIVGNAQQADAAASQTAQRSLSDVPEESKTARQNMLGGAALALVGACAVGVSVVMWSWAPERPHPVSASLKVTPQGGVFSLTGKFP